MKLVTPLVALIVTLCATAAAQDVLRRANGAEPATLDPHKYELQSESTILRDLFEGLTTQDAENRIVPGQAERWDVSADGLIWTFHLRDGLVWSDGAALTADDFVAGMRRAVDPATAANMPDLLFKIAGARAIVEGRAEPETLGVAAPDMRTVVVTLEAPSPLLPAILSTPIAAPLPRHVHARAGEAWARAGTMVSNGAYVLEAWTPSSAVTLARNPRYRLDGAAPIATVRFHPSDDQDAALNRFRAGELDFLPALPVARIAWARAEAPGALKLTPVAQLRYIEINHTRAALRDRRVRRALAMAVDREVVAERLMQGLARPAYGVVPPAIEGYEGAAFDFAGDNQAARIAAAARLLREAGYGPERPLRIQLRTIGDSWARPVATAIAGMWGRIGVQVEQVQSESRAHFAAIDAGDYDVAISGWFGMDDPESFMWLFQSGGGMNESRFSNAAFDAASRAAETTIDLPARYAAFARAERILLDEAAAIPLFWSVQATLTAPGLDGLKATPRGVTRSRFASFSR